jgi:hypothetical protein
MLGVQKIHQGDLFHNNIPLISNAFCCDYKQLNLEFFENIKYIFRS